jgi:phage tail-like protein
MPVGANAGPGQRSDPFRAYNFKITIDGVAEGHFTSCSSMGVSVESISYREGGNQQIVRKLPGIADYCDVTLRYGLTSSRDLFDWMLSSAKGKIDRRHVAIECLAPDGVHTVARWDLIDAWPREWRAAPLDALEPVVAVESVTFVCEAIERREVESVARAEAPEIG